MSNAENRKNLSLLESLHSEAGEPAKGNARRARREGYDVLDPKARRRSQAANAEDPALRNSDDTDSTPRAIAPAIVSEAPTAPNDRGYQVQPQSESLLRSLAPSESDNVLQFSELPQRGRRRSWGGIVSFILCVALPTALAAIYYIQYASSQYVTEFRFAVRDSSTATSTSAVTSGLSAMLGISSTTNPTENYMVTDYITSRQAVEDLQSKIDVRRLYAHPWVDWWSRFDSSQPMERFARYWQYMTTATYDEITGSAVAEIRAFTPEDSYLIASTLLELSENLVNEVAQRPQREAIRYAEDEVRRAEDRLKAIRAEMTEFRNKEGIIDPNVGVVPGNAGLASTLRTALAQLQTDLATAQKQNLNANSPTIQSLRLRIKSTKEQLAAVEAEIRSTSDGIGALSQVVGRYEQLDLERQFAQNMVVSTMQSLEQARANAMAKRIFITPYVRPALPQSSIYPKRVVAILTVAGACFMLWTIALLIVRSIREHLA